MILFIKVPEQVKLIDVDRFFFLKQWSSMRVRDWIDWKRAERNLVGVMEKRGGGYQAQIYIKLIKLYT